MARTYCAGFEVNDNGTQIYTAFGFATFDTTIVRSGTYSAKVVPASGAPGRMAPSFPAAGPPTSGYLRFYIRVTVRPATTARIIFGNTGASQINLRLNADGTVAHYVNSTLTGTSTTALTDTARWYRIEIRTANGTTVPVLLIDGATEVTGTPSSWVYIQSYGASDAVADTYTAYFDDVAIDGAGFPGEGKVVMLFPLSDNAGGTGWVLGTGTALGGNGWNSVDNNPPLGVADLAAGSDPKQIRNATSSANSNYDANLQSYLAAGIQPGDVVNCLIPMVLTGAPVSTSAKQGTIGVASNPAITNIALSAAGTSGAFWSGSAAATYSGGLGWKLSLGTITASPTVTLQTAPVIRITQVTSSTRIAIVCFLAMYVEYLPASRYPNPNAHKVLQHINRASGV